MKKIIVTGFEPFGGETVNPSGQLLELLTAPTDDVTVTTLLLPVEFLQAGQILTRHLEERSGNDRPDAVICLGQAGGRTSVSLERAAINVMDSATADNSGYQPNDVPVVPNGPAAYFSTLPLRKIQTALRENGIPASLSNSAGTYVCNALMYRLLHWTAQHSVDQITKGGFVHIPYSMEQAAAKTSPPASLPLEILAKGLNILLKTVAEDLLSGDDPLKAAIK